MPNDQSVYTWDEGPRQFRDKFGRFVARSNVRASLDRYLDVLQVEIEQVTQELVDQNRSIGSWQAKMEGIIKRSHTAAASIAKGGWKQAGPRDWSRVGNIVKEQYAYLARFARQLEEGRPLSRGTIARAMMYGLAATGTYEEILREDDLREGFDEERRLLHSTESCPQCLEYNAGAKPGNNLGWKPAGQLPGIGQASQCLTRCRCTFERRRSQASRDRRRGNAGLLSRGKKVWQGLKEEGQGLFWWQRKREGKRRVRDGCRGFRKGQ
jgi:hypothetical protein